MKGGFKSLSTNLMEGYNCSDIACLNKRMQPYDTSMLFIHTLKFLRWVLLLVATVTVIFMPLIGLGLFVLSVYSSSLYRSLEETKHSVKYICGSCKAVRNVPRFPYGAILVSHVDFFKRKDL